MDEGQSFISKLEELKKLNDHIDQEVEKRTNLTEKPRYRSSDIDSLAASLSKAQGEYPPIPYNRTNASWNDDYSDLDIVMKYIRPILSKYELALNQWTELTADGGTILHTEVMHSSGQWKESRIKIIPTRNDQKTFDSIMSDMRRQQSLAMLGVTLQGDPKDDAGDIANEASFEEISVPVQKKLVRSKASYECITADQLEELERTLEDYPDLCEELMNKYELRALSDMPKSKFGYAITTLRKLILYRTGERDTLK